jgi:hypothetical protein
MTVRTKLALLFGTTLLLVVAWMLVLVPPAFVVAHAALAYLVVSIGTAVFALIALTEPLAPTSGWSMRDDDD